MKGMEATMHAPTLLADEEDVAREKRRRAARTVAALARDADDCAYLLGALGLTAAEGLAPAVSTL